MSQPKVVPLNPTSKKTSALPPILHTVRQHARRQLASLLERLFNNVDDALFEMADRSRSDADQSLYFESMRELRLQRQNISKRFISAFSEAFTAAYASENTADDAETDFDQVSVLDNDQLELSVAITGITSKITSQYSLQIVQLTRRLDHLAGDELQIGERINPLGPEQISQAFVTALDCADLDIKVRIILLKLFERFVMERLSAFYSDANQMLMEAGVLPDLKNTMRRERVNPRASKKTAAQHDRDLARELEEIDLHATPSYGSQDSVSGGGQGFATIQQLLQAARAQGEGNSMGVRVSGPTVPTQAVLSALAQAQMELPESIDIEAVPPLLDLRQVVLSRAASGAEEGRQLGQADEDVVHFVGMLFDYILNDRNLAIPMKALIGRLQLPIVRLAIMDRSFFDRSDHPARQLLNELSSAGIGWSSAKELKRDAVYNKVESVVLRVLNGFRDNQEIFEELLDDLRRFVKNDTSKREQIEQRVKDNEKGRARTIHAKEIAQKLINQKASGMRLPVEIGRFVSDTWSKVLVYACLKDGEQSAGWQAQAEILDRLIWCIQPLDQVEDMVRRDKMIPELVEDLCAGMTRIQVPEAEVEKRISEIRAHLNNIASNDRAYLDEEEPAPDDDSFEVMDEIVLVLPGESLEGDTHVEIEPEYLDLVGKLQEGSWVEITQPSGEVLRAKLSTIIEPGGRYIFVNRRGMKVAEKSRPGLAVELKRGSLRILEESQIFDRALQAVIGNLRQMHRSASTS